LRNAFRLSPSNIVPAIARRGRRYPKCRNRRPNSAGHSPRGGCLRCRRETRPEKRARWRQGLPPRLRWPPECRSFHRAPPVPDGFLCHMR
jgi:hypothetical protein